METDEYTCTGGGDGTCKRLGSKLSKKSYKETCKFTINSLLSKPDRPHKIPAPHVNCKITNKKAHTVFSFNDSPEKLIKIKSPHMLTAEVKKLYSPPTVENYRYVAVSAKEGLLTTKDAKYARSPSITCSTYSRPTSATISASYRPTTAQLLYQRQLSKQEHRSSKDRSDILSESCGAECESDPFRFTPTKNYTSGGGGGTSPTYKTEKFGSELDKFAYHSPERASPLEQINGFRSPSKIASFPSGKSVSPGSFEEKPSSEERSNIELEEKPSEIKSKTNGHSDTGIWPPNLPLDSTNSITTTCSASPTDTGSSIVSLPQRFIPTKSEQPEPPKVPEDPAPSSKLHRGKLSFFKQAISQEIETLQEEQRAKSLSPNPPPPSCPPPTTPPPPPLPPPPTPTGNPTDGGIATHSLPNLPRELPRELPTNVVRKVIKRPPVPKPLSSPKKQHLPVTQPKTVHSINAKPIPKHSDPLKFSPRAKMNVVKIEKHHVTNQVTSSHGQKNIITDNTKESVFKLNPDKQILQTFGDPLAFNSGNTPKPTKKRKISSDLAPCKVKKETKTHPTLADTPITEKAKSEATPKKCKVFEPTKAHKSRKPSGGATKKIQAQKKVPSSSVRGEIQKVTVKQEPGTDHRKAEPTTSVVQGVKKEEESDHTARVTKSIGIPTPPMSLLSDPKSFLSIEACTDGEATVVRLDMDQFSELNVNQQSLVVDYFFETVFGETNGVADHVMGVISNGSSFLPNVLSYVVRTSPGLKIKHQVLGKKDVLNCTIGEYYEKICNNHSRFIYHEGGLLQTSLVGVKSEESGGFFGELIDLMELSPFFEATLPWGSLSQYEGLDPTISNDGPIFWVRPGEQFLQSTSGSRNHKGYRLLKNRETLVQDRTTPHADHSWEDGKTIATTAAAAFIQEVELPDSVPPPRSNTLKDVIAFDATNFYQLAEELQLDLYEPPMTQCDIWIEDAKLNQLRSQGIKYARVKLKTDDMYFIPRNVIHQFKTVSACLSVAWHVRLKQYYDST